MEIKTVIQQREVKILETIVSILKKYLSPGKIILFGSRGKGKFYRNSDFDIAVDKERPDIRIQRRISEEIDNIAGLYKVDIVYLENVDETFKDLIIRTGKVIYERRN